MAGMSFFLTPINLNLYYLDAFNELYTTDEQVEGMKKKGKIRFDRCDKLKIVFKKLYCRICCSESKADKLV